MRELTAPCADKFHLYVLSDSNLPEIAALEERALPLLPTNGAAASRSVPPARDQHRFKAGNFWDFCQRWGDNHELAVTLDTDSFMTAAAIMRMVRIMQADRKLGILQVGRRPAIDKRLCAHLPIRHAPRHAILHIGSAWWQADCGPYWATTRRFASRRSRPTARFQNYPARAVARPLLSHDQIEAALMRRAGYDVRVLPEEDLGWEENPPTLIEFIPARSPLASGNAAYGFSCFFRD